MDMKANLASPRGCIIASFEGKGFPRRGKSCAPEDSHARHSITAAAPRSRRWRGARTLIALANKTAEVRSMICDSPPRTDKKIRCGKYHLRPRNANRLGQSCGKLRPRVQ